MSRQEQTDDASTEIERTAYRKRIEVFLACRNSGNALTLDSLKTGIRLRTIIGVATEITHSADETMATIMDKYRPPLHCKEGCSHCCCKPGVLTSIPELL